MMFQPIYGLHKDATGKILDAGAFDYSFKLRDWIGLLNIQPGDYIQFGAKVSRDELPEAPPAAPPTAADDGEALAA